MANWDIGVDFGSSALRMCTRERGIIEQVPSLAVVRRSDGQLLAVGAEADAMLGRLSSGFCEAYPVRGGAIEDPRVAEQVLRAFFRKYTMGQTRRQLRVLTAYGPHLRAADRDALAQAMLAAGASAVTMLPAPHMAAMGSQQDIPECAQVVMDMGAGHTSASVLAGGYLLRSEYVRQGGEDALAQLDEGLRAQGVCAGPRTLRDVLHSLGGVAQLEDQPDMAVAVRSLVTGLPQEFRASPALAAQAMAPLMAQARRLVHGMLRQLTPDQAADIGKNGITVTGGVAQVTGIAQALAEGTQLHFAVAPDAPACVIRGILRVMRQRETDPIPRGAHAYKAEDEA